jgi:indole-3-glycerol phosphate synthase
MDILDIIIEQKQKEVAELKKSQKTSDLEKGPFFKRNPLSIGEFLLRKDKNGIIAEFKRRSPSKGIINDRFTVDEVVTAYAQYGASAISVLTDKKFFGGSLHDMTLAATLPVPVLRKDFIIDEFQLLEAKAFGASVILLIAACLSVKRLRELAYFARNLGLGVLLEIHDESELDHICDEVDIVGVNNRDLKTFKVDVTRSEMLSQLIPPDKLKISESGLDRVETLTHLRQFGYNGFLIGERFMKMEHPGEAFRTFAQNLKTES